MDSFNGKVAVITGAASGIGFALASALGREGARLVLADVNEAALRAAAAKLTGVGFAASDVASVVTDVRLPRSVDALADAAFASFGQVDVLVNNAGVFVGGLLWERPPEDLEFVLGVNVLGLVNGIRSFVPRMMAQDTEGHVVNTCSIAGLVPSMLCGPYNISKFAALAASECLALELDVVGSKLKVTAVCPGMVATGLDVGSTASRPSELAVEVSQDAAMMQDELTKALGDGISADEVAAQTLAAIRGGQFLVLTHPHHHADVLATTEALVAGRVPPNGNYR